MNLTTLEHACKYNNWKLVSEKPHRSGNVIYKFSQNGSTWNYFKSTKTNFVFTYTVNRNGTRNSSKKRRDHLHEKIYAAARKYEKVLSGEICYYCHNQTKKVDISEVYGPNYTGSYVYQCKKCEAHVGTHKSDTSSLGFVAKKDLRELRKKVHYHFDKLWKLAVKKGGDRSSSRSNAYKWLSSAMGIKLDYMHIGMLNVDQCKRAIEIIEPYSRHIK